MAERGVSVESEVGKQLDLSVIRYSRVVEDHRVLSRALQIIQNQDVVMCISRYFSIIIVVIVVGTSCLYVIDFVCECVDCDILNLCRPSVLIFPNSFSCSFYFFCIINTHCP